MTKRKRIQSRHCIRLPGIINPLANKYSDKIGRIVNSSISSSSDGAITHILARELGRKEVGPMMEYLRENFGTGENRSLERYSVNVPRLEEELAVAKIKGSLMEVTELPLVSNRELIDALTNRLGGRPSDYNGTIARYKNN